MHTVMVIGGGLALLAMCALVGRVLRGRPGMATGALLFLPLWFIAAGINMYVGVTTAGYGVAEEASIFLIVFGVPAAAGLLAWRRLR